MTLIRFLTIIFFGDFLRDGSFLRTLNIFIALQICLGSFNNLAVAQPSTSPPKPVQKPLHLRNETLSIVFICECSNNDTKQLTLHHDVYSLYSGMHPPLPSCLKFSTEKLNCIFKKKIKTDFLNARDSKSL
jgi:hypothetical protein